MYLIHYIKLISNFTDPPEILPSFISSMTAIEGHDTVLNCAGDGNPAPTITWLFGTEELPGVLPNGSILLPSVQISSEGNYTCHATNLLGSTEASLSLIIQGKLPFAAYTAKKPQILIQKNIRNLIF